MARTKLFVSVRERARLTQSCLLSLAKTTKGQADIYVYDNASKIQLGELMNMYRQMLSQGMIASLVCNAEASMPGVYWSKNFALQQFLRMIILLPGAEFDYVGMIDNDIVFHDQNWLRDSIRVLESPEAMDKKIAVASAYDGPPIYEVDDTIQIAGIECDIRPRLTSRCWIAHRSWWLNQPAPPAEQILRDGQLDRMPTDNWYYEPMIARGEKFAVLNPKKPGVTDPPGQWPSARMSFKIGADCKK